MSEQHGLTAVGAGGVVEAPPHGALVEYWDTRACVEDRLVAAIDYFPFRPELKALFRLAVAEIRTMRRERAEWRKERREWKARVAALTKP